MAFDWLKTPENRIEVIETITNRDGDPIADIVIGTGYGIFRGQTSVEYTSTRAADFNHVGILIEYTPIVESTVAIGEDLYATHMYPEIGDACVWRGIRFSVTGVDPRPDVHGDLVGFTVRCSSG